MTMDPALLQLIEDTERQLAAAREAVAAGSLVDLADLVPRLERISALAVETRAVEAAPLLAQLIERLDSLGAALRARIEVLSTDGQPAPGRAAALYRAAAQPPEGGGEG